MWEPHSSDPNSLTPTNIIDGDTGCFAMNFNMYLDNDFVMNTSSYTLTSRNDAKDLHYEIDNNGNITTKE